MDLPPRSGIAVGPRDLLEASTAEVMEWLRGLGVPGPRLTEVEAMDAGFGPFQRAVLRYGLARALLEKGHRLDRDAAAWDAFDAAMRSRLGA